MAAYFAPQEIKELCAITEDELIALENEANAEDLAYLTKEDCVYWSAKSYWPIYDAAFLLLNLDRRKVFGVIRGHGTDTRTLLSRVNDIMDAYLQRIDLDEVEPLWVPAKDINHIEAFGKDTSQLAVKPKEFLEWAKTKNFPVPEDLWTAVFVPEPLSEIEGQNASKSNILKQVGDFWEVQFDGKTLSGIPGLKGMDYIKLLLESPHEKIHCNRLHTLLTGVPEAQKPKEFDGSMNDKRLESTGMHVSDAMTSHEILDDRAKREIKERLDLLNTKIDDSKNNNDHVRVEELENEKDNLFEVLRVSTDHKGQSRNFTDDIEKTRKNISNRISDALKKLEELEKKKFGDIPIYRHLKNAIITGKECSYEPNDGISISVRGQK